MLYFLLALYEGTRPFIFLPSSSFLGYLLHASLAAYTTLVIVISYTHSLLLCDCRLNSSWLLQPRSFF